MQSTGAESETIDRGWPVQINRMFESKENFIFLLYDLYFSVNRENTRTLTGAYVSSAPNRRQPYTY
jgi:hypothetical protein